MFCYENVFRGICGCIWFKGYLLDYSDVIYDQLFNAFFCQKNWIGQHNAPQEISVAIKSSSFQKLYNDVGLEYIYQKRWVPDGVYSVKYFATGITTGKQYDITFCILLIFYIYLVGCLLFLFSFSFV